MPSWPWGGRIGGRTCCSEGQGLGERHHEDRSGLRPRSARGRARLRHRRAGAFRRGRPAAICKHAPGRARRRLASPVVAAVTRLRRRNSHLPGIMQDRLQITAVRRVNLAAQMAGFAPRRPGRSALTRAMEPRDVQPSMPGDSGGWLSGAAIALHGTSIFSITSIMQTEGVVTRSSITRSQWAGEEWSHGGPTRTAVRSVRPAFAASHLKR